MLDETWSFGVLGRTGRGLTEAQNVDASQVDMIIGSLAGPLCAGGGFCAGSRDVVEHQRISATSYTFSAALPAMLATTASETLNMLQTTPEVLVQCRENIRAMRAQLDPRSDWVVCTSAVENPVLLLVLKGDVVNSRRLSIAEQERVMQECVDEVCILLFYAPRNSILTGNQTLANGVLITRLKSMPLAPNSTVGAKDNEWKLQPALKVCITTGLSKKEIEKAGVIIRHAITKVLTRKTSSKLALPAGN
jgi:7-keto-8-aminopelargonate synthetase-like enzyme